MKTTTALIAFAALAALPALAGDDVQITYRGQVRQVGTTTNTFDTHTMTFRLYAEREDTAASWTDTVADIPVDADGLFQVALRGGGLAKAIDDGKANWLGVTILTGVDTNTPPQEQYPRQALLANPWAAKAGRADALADSPVIGTVAAGSVKAGSLAVDQLSVGKGLQLPVLDFVLWQHHYHVEQHPSMSVHLEGDGWEGKTVPVKGEVHFFSRSRMGTPVALAYSNACSVGYGTTNCNCAVLFREIKTAETGDDRMPGMTLFFKKGENIILPPGLWINDDREVEATVYPIGVD